MGRVGRTSIVIKREVMKCFRLVNVIAIREKVERVQRQCMTTVMLANDRGCKVLVEQGAELDRMDREGWTVPMLSVEGMGKVVRLLVDKGGHSKM